jgi:hypothetical protein
MRFSQGYKPSGVVRQQQPDISIATNVDNISSVTRGIASIARTFYFRRCGRLCRKLEHRCFLTLHQVSQQHHLPSPVPCRLKQELREESRSSQRADPARTSASGDSTDRCESWINSGHAAWLGMSPGRGGPLRSRRVSLTRFRLDAAQLCRSRCRLSFHMRDRHVSDRDCSRYQWCRARIGAGRLVRSAVGRLIGRGLRWCWFPIN